MPTRTSAKKRRAPARRGAAPARRRRSIRAAGRGRARRAGVVVSSVATAVVAVVATVAVAAVFVADALRDAFADDVALAPGSRPLPVLVEPSIAGYGLEQLANACTILVAGRDLGFDERDQTIAVMTAMGESSLRNIDYGDWETSGVTNPDGSRTTSIGLFQQQDGWGSREARLDPYTSASVFYRAMAARVPDRAGIEPTLVAHRTQVNADPQHYARYWDRAVRVEAALGGTPADGDRTAGIPLCPAS